MELEFDKEINAILRKAGRQGSVAVGRSASPHVDADTIAAFAENALPSRARPPLIEHFAACDNCREMLSQTILLNAEADATAASSVGPALISQTAVPWYLRLFKTPGLALAMGGLVLVFTGVLAFLVVQNRNSGGETTVSQVNEPELRRGGPYDSGETSVANTSAFNSNAVPANSASSSANSVSNTVSSAPASVAAANTAPGTLARTDAAELREVPADDGRSTADSVASGAATTTVPATVAPPPSLEPVKTEEDEKKPDLDKQSEASKDLELAKRKEMNDRGRDAPPAAAKSGPVRSGPFQMQSNQGGNRSGDMSVTRSLGGKSFNNRGGVWYDSAYHGQATTNVRRGADEFKKLDSGLRSIANNLGGVVVVVWKDKVYRIQ